MDNLRLTLIGFALFGVLTLIVLAVLWQLDAFRGDRQWHLSTGLPNGTYSKLGEQLSRTLNTKLHPYEKFHATNSAGSVQNMARLREGSANFAIVQSDAEAHADVRLIAPLYVEIVHIAIHADHSESVLRLEDLSALRAVSLGPEESGTRQVAREILEHFEVQLPEKPLASDPGSLRGKFEARELDAALLLAGPGSEVAQDLFDSPAVRLLPLGRGDLEGSSADAFAMLREAFVPTRIPAQLYGRYPQESVNTVGVTALLVASKSVDPGVVHDVTAHLFATRNELAEQIDTPMTLGAPFDPERAVIPFHEGALRYYLRERPSFLVEYAEAISLVITLLVGAWSLCVLVIRWSADLKKQRIDRYYAQVRDTSELSAEERVTTLRSVHRQAFDELIAERLAANESFLIFHDYLISEINRAERELLHTATSADSSADSAS